MYPAKLVEQSVKAITQTVVLDHVKVKNDANANRAQQAAIKYYDDQNTLLSTLFWFPVRQATIG